MKVAKLVLVSLMTRVIVEEDATQEQILEAAKPQFIDKVKTDLADNLEEITDDEEVPYGESPNDKNPPVENEKKEALHNIEILIKSCEEGRDEDWDTTTDEGREGFDDMITLLERVKNFINK